MVFTLMEALLANYEDTRLIMQANPIAFTIEEVKALDKQVAQVSAIIKAHRAELAVRAAALGIHPINSNVYEDAQSPMVFDDAQTPEPVTPEPMTPEPMTPEPVTPKTVTPEPMTPEPVTRMKRNRNKSPESPESPSNRRTGPRNTDFVRQRLQF